ncbi:AAA family ATPase [Empedobacter falsenii]
MAHLYPDFNTINSFKVKPTDGEYNLLNFLVNNLNEEYEVYFQPYLNGDNPDIIVIRKNGGVLIIEVKDWNLKAYQLNDKMDWVLKNNPDVQIKSPLDQVNNYKDNLYNIHSEELFLKQLNSSSAWTVVQCAVYFHNATKKQIEDFHLNNGSSISDNYSKKLQYINWIGKDSLNNTEFDKILNKTRINKNSSLFSDDIYYSILRYLKHPLHVIEDGKIINYTKAQLQLSESKPVRQKIKSAAGCGKTLVLAKRAVNAHIRTDDKVLILTFNLTLVNYIRDRINEVREEFRWSNFEIINYHQFFKAQANNYSVKINNIQDFENIYFFRNVKENIRKYKTIFIDEIQDYKQEWLDIVLEYFADNDAEIVVFGDEKQNIYERELDDSNNIKISKIPGAWNRSLNLNFRSKNEIVKLTNEFQKEYFKTKYDIIEAELQQELQFDQPLIEYYDSENINGTYDLIFEIIKAHQLHPSDCGILSSKVNEIRELDFQIRNSKKEKTTRMFETKEIYQVLKERYPNPRDFENELNKYRRIKKVNFWMNTGLMKLSTIQSFKGWEIDTLFLIINTDTDLHKEIPELVYTGLTRARNNLFLINLGNEKFEGFFIDYINKNIDISLS